MAKPIFSYFFNNISTPSNITSEILQHLFDLMFLRCPLLIEHLLESTLTISFSIFFRNISMLGKLFREYIHRRGR